MLRSKLKLASLIITAALTATQAQAITIDFNALGGSLGASYSEAGVTFTASGGGGGIFAASTPNGTIGLLEATSPFKELRADIAGGASLVSVDLGDFNADADLLFLEAFNLANVSVGYTDLLIASSFSGMETLMLSNPDIAYVIFGARAPAIGGSSVYADNFTFERTVIRAVPEPVTATLGLMSLAALGLASKRRVR